MRSVIELKDGRIASGSCDGIIKIWQFNSQTNQYECIDTFKGHNGWVNSIIELQDGRLASCSNDHEIKIWRNQYHELTKQSDSLDAQTAKALKETTQTFDAQTSKAIALSLAMSNKK